MSNSSYPKPLAKEKKRTIWDICGIKMKKQECRERTQRQLAEALEFYLQKKPLEKITVRELIEKVGINRKTFYYYFPDIYGLLEWMVTQESQRLIFEIQNQEDYENSLALVFDSIEKNRHFVNCVYDSMGRDALVRFLNKDFRKVISWAMEKGMEDVLKRNGGKITEASNPLGIQQKFLDTLVDSYIASIAQILLLYLQKKSPFNKQECIRFILRYLQSTIPAALEEFAK